MNVVTLVVAQLEYDGCLRVFEMRVLPQLPLTIAYADEFDEPHSGPFHFLDEHNKETFEKGFAECKAWNVKGGAKLDQCGGVKVDQRRE